MKRGCWKTMAVMYVLLVVLLLSGNVGIMIAVGLLYNNYLWWQKGFQSREIHLFINAASILFLALYILLHSKVRQNEERKLRELDIKEIF
tara:strand:+ start:95 stop:364 length:270 start_codon:yes stop_codon:yes gene_type:complete